MACQHENFEAEANIGRITGEQNGDIAAYVCELRVRCVDCGEPFGFRGMSPGLSWADPTRSPDAQEARLPLLTPSDMALAGPLPGLRDDPPPPPMPTFGINVS